MAGGKYALRVVITEKNINETSATYNFIAYFIAVETGPGNITGQHWGFNNYNSVTLKINGDQVYYTENACSIHISSDGIAADGTQKQVLNFDQTIIRNPDGTIGFSFVCIFEQLAKSTNVGDYAITVPAGYKPNTNEVTETVTGTAVIVSNAFVYTENKYTQAVPYVYTNGAYTKAPLGYICNASGVYKS